MEKTLEVFNYTGAMHTIGAFTDCDSDEVYAHSYNIRENEENEITKHYQKCDSEGQLEFSCDDTAFSFLTNLPLNVLECIVGYLSVIDTLIACYSTPLLNEHISMLHDSWKRKWSGLCLTNDNLEIEPKTSWKAECERVLALMLKFSNQAMLNPPENLYLRVCVTAMDFCDGMLLCFGEARAQFSTKKIFAYLYQCTKHSWKSVTTFPVPGLPISIASCCLVPGYKIYAGRNDGSFYVWNLEMSSRMVKILSGEKSPFIGYYCVLITTNEESVGISVAMGCWGRQIPLKDALFARKVCHTENYEFGWSQSVIIPNVFVEGGSVVYGLELIDDAQRRVFKLVWQPLDPMDFISSDDSKNNDFRSSLHPSRKDRVIPLAEKTIHILGVGKYFSVSVTKYKYKYSPNLTLILNETGDTDKLLCSWNKYCKMVCSKWLDGLDNIKPGSISLIFITNDEGFMIWSWRKDVFIYNKPSLAELLAVREGRRWGDEVCDHLRLTLWKVLTVFFFFKGNYCVLGLRLGRRKDRLAVYNLRYVETRIPEMLTSTAGRAA